MTTLVAAEIKNYHLFGFANKIIHNILLFRLSVTALLLSVLYDNISVFANDSYTYTMSESQQSKIIIVRDSTLFKSEPNPRMFGNEANPESIEGTKWNNKNWLKSRFHFNFAEYRGGRNNFGALRVANDDLVQPNRGFGTHPHANVEIVTYIVSGALTHKVHSFIL